MHNIKDIRKDLKSFEESLKKRFVNVDIDEIKKLEENNRELIQKKETLEQEKKELSKSKDQNLFKRSKEISSEIDNYSKEQSEIKNRL